MANYPRTLATPREALGPIERQLVLIGGRKLVIHRPTQTDRLLDHRWVNEAFEADEFLPYWTDLWPSARMLAKAILRESWPARQEALELGCGLGLPGVAGLAKGLRVIFSDYDQTALQFAADNALANGYTDFRTLLMDWRCPPEGLRVSTILASDLTYELRNVEPIVALIKSMLLPGGVCLLTDQNRTPAQALQERLHDEGLAFTTRLMRAGEPGGRRVKGTLYRIRQGT